MNKQAFQYFQEDIFEFDMQMKVVDYSLHFDSPFQQNGDLRNRAMNRFLPLDLCRRVEQIMASPAIQSIPYTQIWDDQAHDMLAVLHPNAESNTFLLIISDNSALMKLKNQVDSLNRTIDALLNGIPFSMLITHAQTGEVLHINKHMRYQYQVPDDQDLHVNIADYYVDPQTRVHLRDQLSRYGKVSNFEIPMYDFKKRVYQASLSSVSIHYHNQPAILTTIINISARRQLEESLKKVEKQYRIITENIEDVIWVYNITKSEFEFMSPSIQKLVGKSSEETTKEKLYEMLTEESYQRIQDFMVNELPKADIEKQPITKVLPATHIHKDQSLVKVILHFRVQYNENHELVAFGVSRLAS